jgi:hypothetical protein
MRPTTATLLSVLLVLAATLPLAAVGAVPDARVTVSGLTVTPDAPVVDEPVTVGVTVRNSAGSASPVTVERVRLRTAGGETLASAADPGALSQGDTLTVDLVTAFGSAGRTDLEVVVRGEDAEGNTTRVVRPLTVVVEAAPPQLDAEVGSPVAGTEREILVTVSNPTTTVRRNLEVSLDAPNAVDARATIPALAAGATQAVNLSLRPPAGASTATVSVAYTTSTGARDATTLRVPIEADPLREDVGVAVRPVREQPAGQEGVAGQLQGILGGGTADAGGTLQSDDEGEADADRVAVEVTNFGNAAVRDVVVEPRAGDRALPRQAIGPLAPGESESVVVDLSGVPGGDVTAVASYRVAGVDRTGTATGRFAYDPPAGEVTLTDVDLAFREDGSLLVTGNAGNPGDGEVTGVVVAVGESEHVGPAYPRRTYFVGTVEASEFAPFELTADVDAENATGVPVEVTYRVDGAARTERVTLPYDRSLAPDERGDEGIIARLPGSPLVAGVLAGLLVGALVVGAAVSLSRRRS